MPAFRHCRTFQPTFPLVRCLAYRSDCEHSSRFLDCESAILLQDTSYKEHSKTFAQEASEVASQHGASRMTAAADSQQYLTQDSVEITLYGLVSIGSFWGRWTGRPAPEAQQLSASSSPASKLLNGYSRPRHALQLKGRIHEPQASVALSRIARFSGWFRRHVVLVSSSMNPLISRYLGDRQCASDIQEEALE